MTKETMMRKMFEDWTDAKAGLDNEYERRRDALMAYEGEIDVQDILDLNQWYVQRNHFAKAALELREGGEK